MAHPTSPSGWLSAGMARIHGLAAAALLVIGVFFLFRGLGLYPFIFADEWAYSHYARQLPFAQSPVPEYLYLSIYRLTHVCGDGFLGCARLLNLLFYVATAPLIYALARHYQVTVARAWWVAVLAILAPMNVYTVYFMPESCYFFFMWLFFFGLLTATSADGWWRWFMLGLALGSAALVKPHAQFLLPAIVLYLVYLFRASPGRAVIAALARTAVLCAGMYGLKFSLGYMAAGRAALTLFGPTYNSVAVGAGTAMQRMLAAGPAVLEVLAAHAVVMLAMLALPLAVALRWILQRREVNAAQAQVQNLALFALLSLTSLMLVVSLFTVTVTWVDASQAIGRIHLRYYSFLFPLFLLLVAADGACVRPADARSFRVLGYGLAALTLIAMLAGRARLTPFASIVDCPELLALTHTPSMYRLWALLSVATLVIWVHRRADGWRAYLDVYIPLFFLVALVGIQGSLRAGRTASPADDAGIIVHHYLAHADAEHTVVVASAAEAGEAFRALFHLDAGAASLHLLPDLRGYACTDLPAATAWVLFLGPGAHHCKALEVLTGDNFSLLYLGAPYAIDFATTVRPAVIESMSGLSGHEDFGRWSDGRQVVLTWLRPLPRRFVLQVTAAAFGPNVQRPVSVHCGAARAQLTFAATASTVAVTLNQETQARTLIFDIPQPSSPKSLRLSADERRLGIAFQQLVIHPLE